MRRSALSFVSLVGLFAVGAACGGSTPPTQTPSPPVASESPAPATPPPSRGDAGPGTTTVVGISASAAPGTKLTPATAADAGGAAVPPPHAPEAGRGTTDIRAAVVAHRDEARACYDRALSDHPGIEGNLDIRWTIDPSGRVVDAQVDSSRSDILEPAVANCLLWIIKGLHFPASEKGFETKTHYPFNFHPRGHPTPAPAETWH
jgi:outer membrane biosynthesis protein TonB